MPIIAPDVTPQPIPDVRAQPAAGAETFGGGAGLMAEGQQTQQIARDSGDIATFEMIRANQTAVEEAGAKGIGILTKSLYDPQTGVLAKNGKDALQAQQDWETSTQKQINDIVSGLNGEQQKGAATKLLLAHYADAERTVMVHVDQQLKEHAQDVHEDLVKNQSGFVALNHGDPLSLAHAFESVGNGSDNLARSLRYDSDTAKIQKQQDYDKLYAGYFDGLTKFSADGTPQKKFDEYKDGKGVIQTPDGPVSMPPISPQMQEKIQSALQEHNIRWQAANAVQSILKENPDSESGALKAAEKIENPEVGDAVRRLISARFSENRQAVKNDQDDLFMRMNTMVNQKGLTDPVDRRMAIPPMAWDKLSTEQQRAIEKGGGTDVTSISKWEDYREALKDGSLAKMSQADINTKFMPYMSPEDQKKVVDQWSGLQRGGGGGPKEKTYRSVTQMEDEALINIGALHAEQKQRTEPQMRFQKEFSDAVGRDLDTQEESLGRSLKQDEIQKIIDKHALTAIQNQSGKWFPMVPYEKIPDPDRQHIVELARSVGGVASKSAIENAYKLHKQGKPDDYIAKTLQ